MFRPCIDLHEGKVKQIVGGSLTDNSGQLQTNFTSDHSSAWFAQKYRDDNLKGGHVIQLGRGNENAARKALDAFPGGLQLGGGVNLDNAHAWLDAGATHVIVTSWVFREGILDIERLNRLEKSIGKERLILDLSCRQRNGEYWIVTDRWKNFTELNITHETLDYLSVYCNEFLVHAVDVEGKQTGIDLELIEILAEGSPIPCTYAGGANCLGDLESVHQSGNGRIHLTIGSALDIFGGSIPYAECVAFNQRIA